MEEDEVDATMPPMTLRDRRRTELRQHLSDTATAMFLERGFDEVTVADVAKACGVTEKTVFNHFRTKEALLVDRWPSLTAEVAARVADATRSPVTAVVKALDGELDALTQRGTAPPEHLVAVRRFGTLIATTPALMDHRRRASTHLVEILHRALGARPSAADASEAELRVTAVALSGLFDVFYRSLASNIANSQADSAACRRRVRADVRSAARVLQRGLGDG